MSDSRREFAVDVVRRLTDAGFVALWAGGCVRDSLLGLTPDDYDVATNARPEQVRKLFGHRRTLPIGESFGVILVKGGKEAGDVEVATFRAEGPYKDGRRPESVVFCTPEEDAQRRDFTINGMFFNPLTHQVLDFVGGEADLARRVVRAIGDARDRFTEDKLRMLRAVRMTARFDFTLDAATAQAVRMMADQIPVVSQERIAQELRKMIVHPRRALAIDLAAELGVLPVILPELTRCVDGRGGDGWRRFLRQLELLVEPSFELAMAVLLADAQESPEVCCRRLKLSNREIEKILWLVLHRESLNGADRQRISRLKRLLAHPCAQELLAMVRAELLAGAKPLDDVLFVEDFLARTPPEEIAPPPLLTGDDLKALGLTPGPEFKRILDAVYDAQLEGRVMTKEEALAAAQ